MLFSIDVRLGLHLGVLCHLRAMSGMLMLLLLLICKST